MKNYITSDQTLAATIYILNDEYPQIEYANNSKYNPYFVFKASKQIEETVISYFEGKARVEPKVLIQTQKTLTTPPTSYIDDF